MGLDNDGKMRLRSSKQKASVRHHPEMLGQIQRPSEYLRRPTTTLR
jgi:hypothetical protein